ncbi:HAD family hydrolase [Cytobacillus sp. FJAT-54145]|uniref:HAD family hydrolase n=1 Tax=Cytobacillus spartinae TaxID=3299023 RepID=A0ABW6KEY0_9BACI
MDLSHVKVIVFDLDGTLYEDTHHFNYYADRLKEKLPTDKAMLFEQDYVDASHNHHTLRIGRVYDVEKDLILVQLDGVVQEVFKWDGRALSKVEIEELYPQEIVFDFEKILNIGDPWWIPVSIARHYGLSAEQAYYSFMETRKYMMGPEFEMEIITDFKETLEKVGTVRKLVLLTNSPEPDSSAIIKKLGFSEVFDLKIFDGKKPVETLAQFEKIKDHFGVRYDEILSIGDNWINEIRLAQSMGCSTIFIDPYQLGNVSSADLVVRSIKDVIPILGKSVPV